jgi:hypothetical protein
MGVNMFGEDYDWAVAEHREMLGHGPSKERGGGRFTGNDKEV